MDRRARRLAGLLVTLLSAMGGCQAHSEHMRAAHRPLGAAPAGQARLVVVRPSGWAARERVAIVDEHGRFLGDSLPNSYFATDLGAGRHLIIAEAENSTALAANLAAGKTYVVEVAMRAGTMTPRVELLARRAHTEDWRLATTWLLQTERLETDESGGQVALVHRLGDPSALVRRGRLALAGYDAATLTAHTLARTDGLSGQPFAHIAVSETSPHPATSATPSTPPSPAVASSATPTGPPLDRLGPASQPASPPSTASSALAPSPAASSPARAAHCEQQRDCAADRICIGGSCTSLVACSGDDHECPHGTHCRSGMCRH